MNFEWDERKAEHHPAEHDVAFTEAATAFHDALSVTCVDLDHSMDEDRFITSGASDQGRLLIVAHTEQDETLRIMSARPATARERTLNGLGN